MCMCVCVADGNSGLVHISQCTVSEVSSAALLVRDPKAQIECER